MSSIIKPPLHSRLGNLLLLRVVEKSVESIQCFFQLSQKTIIELVAFEEAQNLRSGQLLAQNLNDSREN
jgi:hypothetical protein